MNWTEFKVARLPHGEKQRESSRIGAIRSEALDLSDDEEARSMMRDCMSPFGEDLARWKIACQEVPPLVLFNADDEPYACTLPFRVTLNPAYPWDGK